MQVFLKTGETCVLVHGGRRGLDIGKLKRELDMTPAPRPSSQSEADGGSSRELLPGRPEDWLWAEGVDRGARTHPQCDGTPGTHPTNQSPRCSENPGRGALGPPRSREPRGRPDGRAGFPLRARPSGHPMWCPSPMRRRGDPAHNVFRGTAGLGAKGGAAVEETRVSASHVSRSPLPPGTGTASRPL